MKKAEDFSKDYINHFYDVENTRRRKEVFGLLNYVEKDMDFSNDYDVLTKVRDVIGYFVNKKGYNPKEVTTNTFMWLKKKHGYSFSDSE